MRRICFPIITSQTFAWNLVAWWQIATGMGCWELAMQDPNLFAAVAPVAGYHKEWMRSDIAQAKIFDSDWNHWSRRGGKLAHLTFDTYYRILRDTNSYHFVLRSQKLLMLKHELIRYQLMFSGHFHNRFLNGGFPSVVWESKIWRPVAFGGPDCHC